MSEEERRRGEAEGLRYDLDAAHAELERLEPWEPDDWRKAVAVDFDGVIHDRPYMEPLGVPTGDPCYGAIEAIQAMLDAGLEVCVFSARIASRRGWEGVEDWLQKWGFPALPLSACKPSVCLYLDDRALKHEGDWETSLATILALT